MHLRNRLHVGAHSILRKFSRDIDWIPFKALEWVGDPRSGTGYHRWFGRANNFDPWSSKWLFGRTDYKHPIFQSIEDEDFDGYARNLYKKIPRQMQTLGRPDSGPSPLWKNLIDYYYSTTDFEGNNYLPLYEGDWQFDHDPDEFGYEKKNPFYKYINKYKPNRNKSEFKIFCKIGRSDNIAWI